MFIHLPMGQNGIQVPRGEHAEHFRLFPPAVHETKFHRQWVQIGNPQNAQRAFALLGVFFLFRFFLKTTFALSQLLLKLRFILRPKSASAQI